MRERERESERESGCVAPTPLQTYVYCSSDGAHMSDVAVCVISVCVCVRVEDRSTASNIVCQHTIPTHGWREH